MSSIYTGQARYIDGIPVVPSTAARNSRYASPPPNFRVYNKETASTELWDGTQWLPLPGSASDVDVIPISSYTGDVGAAITSAIAALPSTGGIVDARSATGAQVLSADLTISSKRVTIWFGRMLLTMGANRIVIPGGTNYVGLLGPSVYGGDDGAANSTYLSYAGAGSAILVGDSVTATQGFLCEDLAVYIGGGNTAAIGMTLANLTQFMVSRTRIISVNTASSQVCLKLDGTGGFTGHGHVVDCLINGGNFGIQMTGSGVNAANANTIENNSISGVLGTGISVEQASDGNVFVGNDIENYTTGLSITGTGGNVGIGMRFEANTTDISLGASSQKNWISTPIITVVVSDSGTGNVVMRGTATAARWGARLGVGADSATDRVVNISSVGAGLAGTLQYGEVLAIGGTSGATSGVVAHSAQATSAAAAYTQAVAWAHQSRAASLGAGSAITRAVGHVMEQQTVGTTNAYNEKQGPNGGFWETGVNTELLTLSTGGTTTDTSANLLPAGAVIEAVCCRVTTTITTATNWSVGDPTTAARFSAANATLVSGTTSIGLDHWSGAVTTLAAGPSQAAAAKVRITTTGTPGAGVIRIVVYYRRFVAPTS